MATYEVQIAGTQDRAKVRTPWVVAVLSFVTLGIYGLYWWYQVNRELRDVGQAKGIDLGQSPANSTLAVFPGGLIIVPFIVTMVRGTRRIQAAQDAAGLTQKLNGWILLILFAIGLSIVGYAYMQSELNKVWENPAMATGPTAG